MKDADHSLLAGQSDRCLVNRPLNRLDLTRAAKKLDVNRPNENNKTNYKILRNGPKITISTITMMPKANSRFAIKLNFLDSNLPANFNCS